MTIATRSVATAALAAAVALAGYLHPTALVGAGFVLVALLAVGWPWLARLPFPPGSSAVVGLAGAGALYAVAFVTASSDLSALSIAMAAALLLSFVNELLRRDGRVRMVESVSGTAAGSVIALTASGWAAADALTGGTALVVTGAVALAVGAAVSALVLRRWVSALVTVASAAGVGALVSIPLASFGPAVGGLLGAAVGVLVAAMDALFDGMPELRRRMPALAAVALPVCVTGMVLYVVGRVLVR